MRKIHFDKELFINSLREYLEFKNEEDILTLLSIVKVEAGSDLNNYGDQNPYRYDILLKVPIERMDPLQAHIDKLHSYINNISDSFATVYINQIMIGILTSKELNQINIVLPSVDHVAYYENTIKMVNDSSVDEIVKTYFIESCNCAINGAYLAAATMLGCAIEKVIIDLAYSFLDYLKVESSEDEINNFNSKVINKKRASDRLSGLLNYLTPKKDFIAQLGLENIDIHLKTFDFIRQLRNDLGHPTR